MDKLTAIKIKYDDNTYSEEIPIGISIENVDYDNTHNLLQVIGDVDLNAGSIQSQIDELLVDIASVRHAVGSPLVAATASAMTNVDKIYIYTGSETGYVNGNWYYYDGTNWTSGGIYNSVAVETDVNLVTPGMAADAAAVGAAIPQVDADLDTTGAAADAKATGDALTEINERLTAIEESGVGISDALKQALLQLAEKVAYIDADGQDYYDALEDALYPTADLVSIIANYTQTNTVYSDDSLSSLKSDLIVTASWSDGTTSIVPSDLYTLSGDMSASSATITVTYQDKTASFVVSVVLVGNINYADALSAWVGYDNTYSDGAIRLKGSQSDANRWSIFAMGRASTLWSTVNGKKLRARFTLYSPDWSGDMSSETPVNMATAGLAIFKNATTVSGADRQKSAGLFVGVPPLEPTEFEYVFDADISNFTSGTGTPTNASTFGLYVYNASVHTMYITAASIVEVLS